MINKKSMEFYNKFDNKGFERIFYLSQAIEIYTLMGSVLDCQFMLLILTCF